MLFNLAKYILLGVVIATSAIGYSQSDAQRKAYFQPEYTAGKIIPNYPDTFPKTSLQQGFTLSIGSTKTDTNSWAKYYNYPETGMMVHYATFGNNQVFGHQVGINPYVSFPVFNRAKAELFKMDMGNAANPILKYNKYLMSPNTNNVIFSANI